MKHHLISIYRQTERFAEITQQLIMNENILRAKKCLAVAEKLLRTGSSETKNLISGIYVHSVSSFMEYRRCQIAGLFPKALQQEYMKQVNATSV